jgi:predicted porin
MKKVLTLAIAAALVAPAAAMADATLFGKVHMAVQNVDDGDDDTWSTDSVASRFGLKGSEDLGDGLSAVYHLEFGVNIDDGSTLSNRNQFVGLAGGFGTFLAGRHDTPMKMSQGKFDEFGDLEYGDIDSVIPGEDRLSDVLAYVSPAMGGLTLVGAAVAGEEGDDTGTNDPDLTSLFDHISLAALYSNGPIFASLAYNSYDTGNLLAESYSPSIIRGTLIWNGGNWQAGGIFASTDMDDLVDDSDAYGLSGHFMVTADDKIKAQWLTGDSPVFGTSAVGLSPNVKVSGGDDEVTQWSIGYEHSFSKRTLVHVGYTNYELDSADDDTTAFFGGLSHSF